MLTKDEVKKVAKLANLPITPEEEDKYATQLSKVLDYIEQLNNVETENIEPTFNVSGKANVEEKDEKGNCGISQDEALANASKKQDGFFVTKGVFEE